MGNFISNQRIETMDGVENKKWTERGVLMDVTVEKSKKGTIIKGMYRHIRAGLVAWRKGRIHRKAIRSTLIRPIF